MVYRYVYVLLTIIVVWTMSTGLSVDSFFQRSDCTNIEAGDIELKICFTRDPLQLLDTHITDTCKSVDTILLDTNMSPTVRTKLLALQQQMNHMQSLANCPALLDIGFTVNWRVNLELLSVVLPLSSNLWHLIQIGARLADRHALNICDKTSTNTHQQSIYIPRTYKPLMLESNYLYHVVIKSTCPNSKAFDPCRADSSNYCSAPNPQDCKTHIDIYSNCNETAKIGKVSYFNHRKLPELRETRYAQVTLPPELEHVTSNVVIGLIKELDYEISNHWLCVANSTDFNVDLSHHQLLTSEEKVKLLLLSDYFGLNHSHQYYQNEAGIYNWD